MINDEQFEYWKAATEKQDKILELLTAIDEKLTRNPGDYWTKDALGTVQQVYANCQIQLFLIKGNLERLE